MKKIVFITLVGITLLGSCNNSSKKNAGYSCPMECEGDSIHAKPGTCSICKMDLEEIEKQ